jgi:hypothetical protein
LFRVVFAFLSNTLHSYEEKKLTAKFFSIYLPVSAPNCPARNVVFNEKITEISAFWVEISVIFFVGT